MTILEELIDAALKTCENQRHNVHQKDHSRAAVLLSSAGKMYVGCDLLVPGDAVPVAAEKSALLAAVADGNTSFEVSDHSQLSLAPTSFFPYSVE